VCVILGGWSERGITVSPREFQEWDEIGMTTLSWEFQRGRDVGNLCYIYICWIIIGVSVLNYI